MARRKRHTKKTHRRRRSIGAISGGMGKVAGVAAGAIAAQFLAKFIPVENEKVKAGIQLAAGVFFPKLMKGSTGEALGAGMVAAGAVNLAKSFNIAGIGEDDSLMLPVSVNGIGDNMEVIGADDDRVLTGMGADDLSVIAGLEEF